MGIKGLSSFIAKVCPDIATTVSIRNYAYQRIAIDISLYLYKYKVIYGQDWLRAVINLVCCLRLNDVHCIFIYETGCPPEKEKTRQERREAQDKLKTKLFEIEEAYLKMVNTGEISDILIEVTEKINSRNNKPILRKKINESVDIQIIEKEIAKLKSQTIGISKEDILTSQELFRYLGIPYLEIDDEGERIAAWLCLSGKVDAVLSDDSDVMVYGTPKFLSKVDTTSSTFVEIKPSDILESLELTLPQFQDLCIMCGTDYNPNIKGIGPHKAYKLIKERENIEGVGEIMNIECLNHKRIRELFSSSDRFKDYTVPYCKPVDYVLLEKFLEEKGYASMISKINKAFSEPEIIFE